MARSRILQADVIVLWCPRIQEHTSKGPKTIARLRPRQHTRKTLTSTEAKLCVTLKSAIVGAMSEEFCDWSRNPTMDPVACRR